MKAVYIAGLGYVGQTLAVVLAESGIKVYGVDVDPAVFSALEQQRSHIHEKDMNHYIKKHIGKNLVAGRPEEIYKKYEADAYIVCVSTPIDPATKTPNLSTIESTMREIACNLKKGQLVVLRSTVPVGTTRNIARPILEESGLKAGEDFFLVHAPERTAQGVAVQELKTLPQIIGGINEASVDQAIRLFKTITPTILTVSSLEAAELIKLIDNSYRDLRFAFANELSAYCRKLGLNMHEVVAAANQGYPRNNVPCPSPGIGGICLNKDPHILIDCARKEGVELGLIRRAREVNESMPRQVAEHLKKYNLAKKKMLIAGFAFKGHPETNDIRESPTLKLLTHLPKGVEVMGYDPVVEKEKIEAAGVRHLSSIEDGLKKADIVVFMTNHSSFQSVAMFDKLSLLKKGAVLFDGWGLFKKADVESLGVTYDGVGIG